MDRAEQVARDWFANQGFSEVVHEPNGHSTFPDFLLDNSVLAEVTWLFQTDVTTGKPLIEKEMPLVCAVSKFLEEKGRGSELASYFVDFVFERPLFGSRLELESALEKALNEGIKRPHGRTDLGSGSAGHNGAQDDSAVCHCVRAVSRGRHCTWLVAVALWPVELTERVSMRDTVLRNWLS